MGRAPGAALWINGAPGLPPALPNLPPQHDQSSVRLARLIMSVVGCVTTWSVPAAHVTSDGLSVWRMGSGMSPMIVWPRAGSSLNLPQAG
jgi:hypothetical protein